MKQAILSALMLLLLACNQGRNASIEKRDQDSINYVRESVAFINTVAHDQLKDQIILLEDKPFDFHEFECLEELTNDSSFYSTAELNLILHKKYPAVSCWTKDMFPRINFISSDSISAAFGSNGGGWRHLYQKFGQSFTTFSMPIFLRGNTYCLFYNATSCGSKCGRGKFTLYKKVNANWVVVKLYCEWVS